MSLKISDALLAQIQSTSKTPILIMEIEGVGSFSSTQVSKYASYGDAIYYGDSGLYYGGLIDDLDIKSWIDLSRSSNQITQQLIADKGGFSSVTNFDVAVIDKGGKVSEMIKSANLVPDILSCKARLYLCFDGAGHPHDSVLFFAGIVSGAPAGAGYIKFNLSSPEKLKNLEIFPKVSTVSTAIISSIDTTITVESTSDFMTHDASNGLRTYLILNDEIIEYAGKTSTTFTGCVRGQFNTIAAGYAINQNIESAYRLIGNLRDLALRLMLSGKNTNYYESGVISGVNVYGSEYISNAVFIDDLNFKNIYGVVIGDSITISGDAISSNNGTATIIDIGTTATATYFILNRSLLDSGVATFSLLSQYSVYPKFAGLEMTPDQVDVQEFIDKYNRFSASFFSYDFFIKDAIKGSDFINQQILYPSGCYALPRKAKTSIGITIPPLAQSETKTISWENVTNASAIVIERSINQNFYNAVIYKYDLDQVDDKYKRGKIRQSSDSTNRIKIANKPLTIEADGIRYDGNFNSLFIINGRRFLDRYQYGAQSLELDVLFGEAFGIEIGDTVIFQGAELKVSDTTTGNRDFVPRLFEVVNKTLRLSGQPIRLKLLDTAFSLNGRYGVISPSSKIDVGSTASTLRLKRSFGTTLTSVTEGFKWRNLIGQTIRVRSKDYSFDQQSIITAIDPTNSNGLLISPALSPAPSENYIVEVASYGTGTDFRFNSLCKALYVFFDYQISVATGISQTQFTVSGGALSKIKVGYVVKIHDTTYTNESTERLVTDVTGVTITVEDVLGFIPSAGQKIELLGFADGGKPYRIL